MSSSFSWIISVPLKKELHKTLTSKIRHILHLTFDVNFMWSTFCFETMCTPSRHVTNRTFRAFSKHFLPPVNGGKKLNSNWISKTQFTIPCINKPILHDTKTFFSFLILRRSFSLSEYCNPFRNFNNFVILMNFLQLSKATNGSILSLISCIKSPKFAEPPKPRALWCKNSIPVEKRW